MSARILIVEDEQSLAEGLRFNLDAEGYSVSVAETGETALALLEGAEFDLILLDVMLPGIDGFTVVERMRAAGRFEPVLLLTARSRPEDIVTGLSRGADDYLAKPFDLSVLLARIQGLLRRHRWIRAPAEQAPAISFTFNATIVDFGSMTLTREERTWPLTVMEASLLRYLIEREGQVVSRKELLEEVWGVHEDTDTRAIDNFIVRLRRYLEPDPTRPRHLVTVRGVGYKFVTE